MDHKETGTLEHEKVERFSDEDLEFFEKLIHKKINTAKETIGVLENLVAKGDNVNESYKPYDSNEEEITKGIEHLDAIKRQKKFIEELEDALERIKRKDYGICRVTGKLINRKRLELVPHATLSIEAKNRINKN